MKEILLQEIELNNNIINCLEEENSQLLRLVSEEIKDDTFVSKFKFDYRKFLQGELKMYEIRTIKKDKLIRKCKFSTPAELRRFIMEYTLSISELSSHIKFYFKVAFDD